MIFLSLFVCSFCRGNIIRKRLKNKGLEKRYNGAGLTIERMVQNFCTLCMTLVLVSFIDYILSTKRLEPTILIYTRNLTPLNFSFLNLVVIYL